MTWEEIYQILHKMTPAERASAALVFTKKQHPKHPECCAAKVVKEFQWEQDLPWLETQDEEIEVGFA